MTVTREKQTMEAEFKLQLSRERENIEGESKMKLRTMSNELDQERRQRDSLETQIQRIKKVIHLEIIYLLDV